MTPSIPTLENTKIGVHYSKYVYGIDSVDGPHLKDGVPFIPENHIIYSIKELLETEFPSEAMATCYNIPSEASWPLIKKRALADVRAHGGELYMPVLVFDWDTEGHLPWTEESFINFLERFEALSNHSVLGQWAAFYTTKKGARILYLLDKPVVVEEGEQYLAYMFHQFEIAGMPVDENCKDWTRRFLCPRVIRDGQRTSSNPFFCIESRNVLLKTEKLGKLPARAIPKLISTSSKSRGQPAHDEVDDYLRTKDPKTGNLNQSSFYKDAKTALKGIACCLPLFKADVPLCGAGERNDTIMKVLGLAIPKLLRKIPYLTPEQVYALFHGPVSQFEETRDWYGHTWNAILSIWDVEVEKYNVEKKEEAEQEIEAYTNIQKIAEGMKVWCKSPELENPDTAPDFVRRHALANIGRFFFLIGLDGYYQPFPIMREQLISRIRTTHLNSILPTTTIGSQGQPVSMPITDVQNEYSTPVEAVEMRPQFDFEGIIEDLDGMHPTMVCPMYRRNPNLEPEFDEDVDLWLRHFLPNYEVGCDWIGHSLAFEDGAICGLSIAGPPGTGKQVFVRGLAECLEKPYVATGAAVSGEWNEELAKTPFLVINEALPKKQGSMAFSELFKALTAADKITVKEKFKPNIQVSNPMRVIFTANNNDIVMDLVKGKEMTPDDRLAVGERLLHFNQDAAAAHFLKSRGDYAFTGRPGRLWIADGANHSDFVVAKHFLWLYENRKKLTHRKRYLVEGNSHGGSSTLARATTAKESTADIGHALIQLIQGGDKYRTSLKIDSRTGALSVTVMKVREFIDTMLGKKMTFHECSQALRNVEICAPQVISNMEWHEIDCRILLDQAREWGIEANQVRGLVKRQIESGYLNGK